MEPAVVCEQGKTAICLIFLSQCSGCLSALDTELLCSISSLGYLSYSVHLDLPIIIDYCPRNPLGGFMFNVLASRSSSLGPSPDCGHCVVFLDKTFCSHSASLHPADKFTAGVILQWTNFPYILGEVEILLSSSLIGHLAHIQTFRNPCSCSF